MSKGIQPAVFLSLMQLLSQLHIHAHRCACAHLLSNREGSDYAHEPTKYLQLVTHRKAVSGVGSAESVPPCDTDVKQEFINNEWMKGSAGMEELKSR